MDCYCDINSTPCVCANVVSDFGQEQIDWFDFEVLLGLVASGNPAGDLNCDGNTDPDDLGDWINAYFLCTE